MYKYNARYNANKHSDILAIQKILINEYWATSHLDHNYIFISNKDHGYSINTWFMEP